MKEKSITSISFILVGNSIVFVESIYALNKNNVGNSATQAIITMIGFIFYFIGLRTFKLSIDLDNKGIKGVSLLLYGALAGIIANLIFLLVLKSQVLSEILYLILFAVQFVGLLKLKDSKISGFFILYASGAITYLLFGIGFKIIGVILGMSAFESGMANMIIAIPALLLILFGWMKVQKEIINLDKSIQECVDKIESSKV